MIQVKPVIWEGQMAQEDVHHLVLSKVVMNVHGVAQPLLIQVLAMFYVEMDSMIAAKHVI